jgi:hypothetical protein
MSVEKQNTNYNPGKRAQDNQTIYNYTRPFQSMTEDLVHNQLVRNSSVDAANRRPPIPNIGKIPDRFGYSQWTPSISDILVVDDSFAAQFGNFSGTESGFEGTSYPSVPQM